MPKRYSIIHDMNAGECLICKTTYNTHIHEVFYGSRRQTSIKYGCCVRLCARHHNMSSEGVHFNTELDRKLKAYTQKRFNEVYPDLDFLRIFGKNYL